MSFRPATGANWLAVLCAAQAVAEPAVLVTVARAEGSTPRPPGARMVVGRDWQADTIGGGMLEFRAIDEARAILSQVAADAAAPRRMRVRMSLGASLGQCCGGVAHLAFELIDASDAGWLQQLVAADRARQILVRQVPLQSGAPLTLAERDEVGETRLLRLDDAEWLIDVVHPATLQVVLYGAGHVGQALVHVLSALPCHVTWLDPRDEVFPASLPGNVIAEFGDEGDVARQQAGAYWLILTHSHTLDFDILEAVLRRDDAAYVGLIGSKSKRASFVRRLRDKGLTAESIERQLTCPIGVEGIAGKEPAVIAVAVAAQLLQRFEASRGTAGHAIKQ